MNVRKLTDATPWPFRKNQAAGSHKTSERKLIVATQNLLDHQSIFSFFRL